jgi:hypothetical protein
MLAYFNLARAERSEVRLSAATSGGFSLLQNAQIGCGALPASYLTFGGVLCWAELAGT